MCGRFDLHTPRALIAETWFGITRSVGDVWSRYNTPPGVGITSIRQSDHGVQFDLAMWEFRPSWAGDDAPRPINARAETVATSKYFSHAFAHKRCLVPANGWFEWGPGQNGKQPYYITDPTQKHGDVLFFAGIYSGQVDTGYSVAILTEPAAPNLRHMHDRQPIVLDPECRYDWINPEITGRDQIREISKRLDPERLDSWPVTLKMNKPDYDGPSTIEPIE